jgi:hypothetical protein
MKAEVKDEVAGTAAQVVFDYPGWGSEHVSDMYDACKEGSTSMGEKLPYSYYDLEDACHLAQKAKNQGLDYFGAIDFVKENLA